MNENKRSRPRCSEHQGRQTETGTFSGATTSTIYNNTQQTGRQPGKIEQLLSHGAENAVPLQYLVKLMDKPARQVRQQIQAERLRGIPILSDNEHGYTAAHRRLRWAFPLPQEIGHTLALRCQLQFVYLPLIERIRCLLDGHDRVEIIAVPLQAVAVDVAGALHRDELPFCQFVDVFHHSVDCQPGGS